MQRLPDLKEVREHVKESLRTIRPDIKRNLNPTPYKVSIVLIIICTLIKLIIYLFIKIGFCDR